MRLTHLAAAGGALAVLSASLAFPVPAAAGDEPTSDLPAGILLTEVQAGPDAKVVFADSARKPLYVSAKDTTAGKSSCVAECLKRWSPALAPRNARAMSDWSLMRRADGSRQWAYRGKPLYSFVGEPRPADTPVGEARFFQFLPHPAGQGLDGAWSVAEASPAKWYRLPLGLGAAETPAAPGYVLVTAEGQPLYAFTGQPRDERRLQDGWRPYLAGMLELPIGRDYTIRTRPDGARQWAYRGALLYSFEGDIQPGDLNGKDIERQMTPVVLLNYFLPNEVVLVKDQKRGARLMDSSTGHTLYIRDREHYALVSDDLRGTRVSPVAGEAIGLSGCDAACERTWRPVRAPADAQPNGYWTVLARPDGSKQWAYRGYALYSKQDEPPGVTFGQETWTYNVDDGTGKPVVDEHGLALFWRVAAL
jgi:predicted lipoprotein with Yx(FWY)xxD motif